MATLILEPRAGAQLDGLFQLPAGVSALERLQVYANGYPARLHEALADAFPAVAHVIGHGAFHTLTGRYMNERPPLYYNINDVGAGLPAFLRSNVPTADLPFLPDLAELEWSLVEAFNAHAKPAVDAMQLASLGIDDWDRVVLHLHAGLGVLTSAWPIREIWEARETPVESIDIDLENRPDQVLIHRSGFQVRCESIDAGEAFALTEIQRGRALGEVAMDLAARGCDDGAVSSWFGRWIELGLVAEVTWETPRTPRIKRMTESKGLQCNR
jgi:hypothetical protein